MFKDPFSFEGRIRRTEYGISLIIYAVALTIVQLMLGAMIASSSSSYSSSSDTGGYLVLFFIFMIPLLIFLWAQGAKRCHDVGNSGWWQLIPLYGFILIFQEGDKGDNRFGKDPKAPSTPSLNSPQPPATTGYGGYQGGYNGGHNNHNAYSSTPQNQTSSGEYRSGDMYR
jgi:uncharacterized membrane protein YhaH (DUF805 family)